MPTYVYKCKKCDHEFDVFQKMSDAPPTECPKCGADVKRVFHPVGIIFKGSGFYTTDYKRRSTQPAPAEAKKEKQAEKKDKETAPAEKKLEKTAT